MLDLINEVISAEARIGSSVKSDDDFSVIVSSSIHDELRINWIEPKNLVGSILAEESL